LALESGRADQTSDWIFGRRRPGADSIIFLGTHNDEEVAKRLALGMAVLCVRNTCIEDIHAGIEPNSQAGDFSDVKVVTAVWRN
jgi:hypothetical protein